VRVLVCGSRDWPYRGLIRRVLEQSGATEIIHGDCRGADRIAGEIAKGMGLKVIAVPACWHLHGKAAGPIRNQEMLGLHPEKVIAFHNDIENSRGTKDMVARARAAGIPVSIVTT
jgi:hypothetical protein